jgi:uncharacterized protein (DUF488 family)
MPNRRPADRLRQGYGGPPKLYAKAEAGHDVRKIWTIGHSTRTADEFIALLRANAIDGLADIRTIPKSRRHPHFARESLDARLAQESIEYRHFAALGGLRKPRPDSPNGAWRNASFRGYADHMMTADFAAAIDELLGFGERRNVAVMCAEAVWWQCHRMLLSDALVARDVDVQHIMSAKGASTLQPHRLTPFAQIRADGRVWYPGLV